MAFLDEKHSTIRCSDCVLLVHIDSHATYDVPRCSRCQQYRNNLRALVSRSEKQPERESDSTDPSSHTPFRHLNSPEKAIRYQREHALRRSCQRQITRLSDKLEASTQQRGFVEDMALHDDLSQIVAENAQAMADSIPAGTFARIFWDSQKKAATLKDARQMRWDPIMVRWCLYLRHLSSSAYETLRDTGTIRLPSQRTLRDYTHHTKATVGFLKEVDKQLQVAANMSSCPEREKCVIIIMDEMHLREDLAYDKHTGKCQLVKYTYTISCIDSHSHVCRCPNWLH